MKTFSSKSTLYYFALLFCSSFFVISCSDEYAEDLCLVSHEVESRDIPCCADAQVTLMSGAVTEGSDCCFYRLQVILPEGCTTNLYDDEGNVIFVFTNTSTTTSIHYCGGKRKKPTVFSIGDTYDEPCYTIDVANNTIGPNNMFIYEFDCHLKVVDKNITLDPVDCCPIPYSLSDPSIAGINGCCEFTVTISNPPCETCEYKLSFNNGVGNDDYTNFPPFVNGASALTFQYCEDSNMTYGITTYIGKVPCQDLTSELNCN